VERRAEEWNANGRRVTPLLLSLIAGGGLNDHWRDLGERAFVDTIGVLIAGASDPAVAAVSATVDETAGPVRAVATGASMSARSAALLDGTAAHALDYDDVDDALIAHPSAVLVPALLAAGQLHDSTGEELLEAYRVGIEAGRSVAAALGITGHYELGWHSTGTIGTISAACALARLAHLGPDQAGHALGVAGSLAAGSRQNFGTMTKPLHAGAAAANGLLAVRLAAAGLTSDPGQLDGPLGFLALHSPAHPDIGPGLLDAAVPGAGPDGLNVKLYPCCYYVHAAAEAAIELGRKLSDPAAVAGVEVVVQPGGLAPLIHHRPVDGTQAKFSMEYVVAACLLDHELTLGSFQTSRVQRPDAQELLRLVEPTTANEAGSEPGDAYAEVTVRTRDGRRVQSRIGRPAGHASRPLTESQLRDKFDDCARGLGRPRADKAYEALRSLRRQPSTAMVVDAVVPRRVRDEDRGPV
jgi:2-methylcitrate dehydratase PrpD